MNSRRMAVCFVATAALLPAWAFGGERGTSAPLWNVLVDAMAKQALQRPVLGISIAVAHDDKVVFARGYGFADLERTKPVTPETVFHVASISKNIAAAVLLQLADQKKLNLDDDVTRYVPNPPTHGKRITIRQLLSHTSGIHNLTSLPNVEQYEIENLSHDEVLELIKDTPLDFEPGTSWRYSNSGFYLAGMVAEAATRTRYADYLRDRIFAPLGMRSSSLCNADTPVPNLAAGSIVSRGVLGAAPPMTWKFPFSAGSVCSTASDLLRWQIALDRGRVVSRDGLKLMRTPTELADGTLIDYGLGTRIGALEGHRVFGHTGSGGGFTTVLETFPDDHLSIAVLVNTASEGVATSLAGEVARAALGITPAPLRDLPVTPAESACIPGTYDSDEGPVEIIAENDRLHFRIPDESGTSGTMRRQGELRYAIDQAERIRFLCLEGHSKWALVYSSGLMSDAKRADDKH